MLSTLHMGLTAWDSRDDFFSNDQLTANMELIDAHDHSPNKGVPIGTAGIQTSAITGDLIANGAVGPSELASNAVGTSKIQDKAVSNAKLGTGSVFGDVVPAGAITTTMLETNVLPIGTVLAWYRPDSSQPLPAGGWEIMDGRLWNTISNAWGLTTGRIPDLRGGFARGADVAGSVGPAIGAAGGSNTTNLSHAHTVNSHTHSVPNHQHGILPDGLHSHTWGSGKSMWTRTNSFVAGLTINDHADVQRQNTYYSMYVKNGNWGSSDTDADMDAVGLHSHGANTQFSANMATGTATATTDSQLGSASTLPQYVGLLYIMRVR